MGTPDVLGVGLFRSHQVYNSSATMTSVVIMVFVVVSADDGVERRAVRCLAPSSLGCIFVQLFQKI